MTKDIDLLVIGEINPDLIAQSEEIIPEFNQTEKLIERLSLTIGSSSVIMACGAARLGLRVTFIGLVGDDLFGHFMIKEMQSHGLNTDEVVIDPIQATGISIILAKATDRAILTFPGTIPELQMSHINLGIMDRASHVHVGSYFLLDKLQRDLPEIFRIAKEKGISTSLDTNWDPNGRWDIGSIIPFIDILFPNENELLNLTRETDLSAGLEKMSDAIPLIAVKLGENGAMARQSDQIFESASIKVNVVDTVGAGDCFDAGFIYAYLNGMDLQECLRIACICGSLSTRASGGTEGQATLDDLIAYGIDLNAKKQKRGRA
jgi:sugar/nucleoside kinase (ribokinase family)